jgi:PTH2 family peptidyl-tRNA hydrolase
MGDYKQVFLVRQDLKLSKGKMSAQVAHASIDAYIKADKKLAREWYETGMKKTVLKVADEAELMDYFKKAKQAGLTAVIIQDAGHTHVAPGTKTVCGIGPDSEDKIDKITGNLKLIS